MKRTVVGGMVLLGILAIGARGGAQECDQLHKLEPPRAISDRGGDDFRARRDLRKKAEQECETFCNQVDHCDGEEKCRTILPPAGAPLTTWPKCSSEGGGKDKTYKCDAQLRYCPCVCESEMPVGNPPRECKGVHDVAFRHKIRGTGIASNLPGDAEKAVGRAREDMKEMARSACDAFCTSIGCPDDDPCIRDGVAPGDAIDPPDGDCNTQGQTTICEAALKKCKCKCAGK